MNGADCFHDRQTSFVRYQYTGEGKGGYEKVPTYTFVGAGKGSFDKQVLDTPYGSQPHPLCLCCLMASAFILAAYIWALHMQDAASGELVSVTTPSSPLDETVSTGPPYDCQELAGARQRGEDVPAEQQDWCCRKRQINCPTSRSGEPYNCERNFADWRNSWLPGKKAYCCKMFARGCEVSTTRTYDCKANFRHWRTAWSDAQQRFCCDKQRRGCPKTTTEPFDCGAGFSEWQTAWSIRKKVWCCENYFRGCMKDQ